MITPAQRAEIRRLSNVTSYVCLVSGQRLAVQRRREAPSAATA